MFSETQVALPSLAPFPQLRVPATTAATAPPHHCKFLRFRISWPPPIPVQCPQKKAGMTLAVSCTFSRVLSRSYAGLDLVKQASKQGGMCSNITTRKCSAAAHMGTRAGGDMEQACAETVWSKSHVYASSLAVDTTGASVTPFIPPCFQSKVFCRISCI